MGEYTYTIDEQLCIRGYHEGRLYLEQPFDPVTGQPFVSHEAATNWAVENISRMNDLNG